MWFAVSETCICRLLQVSNAKDESELSVVSVHFACCHTVSYVGAQAQRASHETAHLHANDIHEIHLVFQFDSVLFNF